MCSNFDIDISEMAPFIVNRHLDVVFSPGIWTTLVCMVSVEKDHVLKSFAIDS